MRIDADVAHGGETARSVTRALGSLRSASAADFCSTRRGSASSMSAKCVWQSISPGARHSREIDDSFAHGNGQVLANRFNSATAHRSI